jgi:hypothetical protein
MLAADVLDYWSLGIAIVSLIGGLGWNVYAWIRSGARIVVSNELGRLETPGQFGNPVGFDLVFLKVNNRGRQAATIMGAGFIVSERRVGLPDEHRPLAPLPFRLEGHDQWDAGVLTADYLRRNLSRAGFTGRVRLRGCVNIGSDDEVMARTTFDLDVDALDGVQRKTPDV